MTFADGIHFSSPVYIFWTFKVLVAIDFHYMNHQGEWFNLKIFFNVLQKKKKALTS